METKTNVERVTIYDRIAGLTPGWLEAREKAERADHMSAWLNLQETDSMSPINRLLEELVQLDGN